MSVSVGRTGRNPEQARTNMWQATAMSHVTRRGKRCAVQGRGGGNQDIP